MKYDKKLLTAVTVSTLFISPAVLAETGNAKGSDGVTDIDNQIEVIMLAEHHMEGQTEDGRPIPEVDEGISSPSSEMNSAKGKMHGLDEKNPIPEAEDNLKAHGEYLKSGKGTAHEMGDKHPIPDEEDGMDMDKHQ